MIKNQVRLLYRYDRIKRCTIYYYITISIGGMFCTAREKKKNVDEPVMPLEPGKKKEKPAADVVIERK